MRAEESGLRGVGKGLANGVSVEQFKGPSISSPVNIGGDARELVGEFGGKGGFHGAGRVVGVQKALSRVGGEVAGEVVLRGEEVNVVAGRENFSLGVQVVSRGHAVVAGDKAEG